MLFVGTCLLFSTMRYIYNIVLFIKMYLIDKQKGGGEKETWETVLNSTLAQNMVAISIFDVHSRSPHPHPHPLAVRFCGRASSGRKHNFAAVLVLLDWGSPLDSWGLGNTQGKRPKHTGFCTPWHSQPVMAALGHAELSCLFPSLLGLPEAMRLSLLRQLFLGC